MTASPSPSPEAQVKIQLLLRELEASRGDRQAGKRLRQKLRNLGHWGGLRGVRAGSAADEMGINLNVEIPKWSAAHSAPRSLPTGLLWPRMAAQQSKCIATLTRPQQLPMAPGVYAMYRGGSPVYVGKAGCLRDRIWKNHCRQGVTMTNSAFRRNVAEHLGIASSADIKSRRYRPNVAEAAKVREWVETCEVRWIECNTEMEACDLEDAMKAEWMPLLTKR